MRFAATVVCLLLMIPLAGCFHHSNTMSDDAPPSAVVDTSDENTTRASETPGAAPKEAAVTIVAYPDDSWEAGAERRIEAHRKGSLTVRVVDPEGRPVEGATVHAAMQRHAFAWGSAVNAKLLVELPEDDPYKTWVARLFNQATLNNYHKWKFQANEEKREIAAKAVQWLHDHDIRVHGHTMIWASLRWKPMPKDVVEMCQSDDPNAAFLRERSLAHIAEIGRRLHGDVVAWDVVNEPYSERAIQKIVNPDAARGQEPILVEWFKAAREAEPDVPLYVNDFHILVGDDTEHKDSYEATIRYLLDQGAPLGGIGMQCHYYRADLRRTPEQMLQVLDRFADFGLPIHLSEFDMFGKGWGHGQERQQTHAEFMREIMTVAFSHPSVEAFTIWNFWDGRHWADEAPLFFEDWTPKQALDVYQDLVFNHWWTDETLRTDAEGHAALRGFLGTYELAVTAPGVRTETLQVLLDRDGTTVDVTLE